MWACSAPRLGSPSPPARPPAGSSADALGSEPGPAHAGCSRGPRRGPRGLAGYLVEAGVSRNFRIACSTSSFFIRASSLARRPSQSSVCSSRFSSVFL